MNDKAMIVDKVKSLLDLVEKEAKKATMNIVSKEEGIREHCVRLRNKVDTQSEELIEEIRQWNEKMQGEIDEYEKECLEKFKGDEFEASAVELKSQLDEMSEQQKRLEEQIGDVASDTIKLEWLYKSAVSKLLDLKQEDAMLTKRKFGDKLLELQEKLFDPSCLSLLSKQSIKGAISFSIEHDIPGIDSMHRFETLKNMPEFKNLQDCFINPYSSSSTELIAIVETKSSVNLLVKMDKSGRILQQQPTKLNNVLQAQATRDCFIVLDYESAGGFRYHQFDYDLNQLHTPNVVNRVQPIFTVNQRYIVEYKWSDPKYVHLFSHDFASCRICELPDEYDIEEMLADETFLYIWCEDKQLRIFDIESKRADDQDKNSKIHLVAEKCCDVAPSKLVGDEYIATYNREKSMLSLYTQDSRLELTKEYTMKLEGRSSIKVSTDCSNGLCFYTRRGVVYHNLH